MSDRVRSILVILIGFLSINANAQSIRLNSVQSGSFSVTEISQQIISNNYKYISLSKIIEMININKNGARLISFDCFDDRGRKNLCEFVSDISDSFSINRVGLSFYFFNNRMYTEKDYPTLVYFFEGDEDKCRIDKKKIATLVYIGKNLNRSGVVDCIGDSLRSEIVRKTGLDEDILDLIAYEFALDGIITYVPVSESVAKMNEEFGKFVK
ncbi:hypothetical protein FDK21_14985 [Cohaesibacter sp. CAU 1516]|uniref:hypothetical protein n=1 Tax=Cohaesibacter sp. CAU 1516 TaxID=2576038 RepID=UPI0010FD18D4|nr:hypothetical protein [Cohaesibacter sp. CAU 1516]TLP44113.1 hypothetical protein FDK21_14985 [Cohaesibacter sp. CAU 1516]